MDRRQVLSLIAGAGGAGGAVALAAGVDKASSLRQGGDSQAEAQRDDQGSPQSGNSDNTGVDWKRTKIKMAIHSQTNVVRQKENLSEVTWNSQLAPVAQSYAETMSETNFVSHTSPEGVTADDRYKTAGVSCEPKENLLQMNWGTLQTQAAEVQNSESVYVAVARVVVAAWMRNDMSRQRLLSSTVESAATGAALSSDNQVFIVQDMC